MKNERWRSCCKTQINQYHQNGCVNHKSRSEPCVVCWEPIEVMAFKGTNFCSVKCQKIAGKDVSSVGTIMFVTSEEKEMITRGRE